MADEEIAQHYGACGQGSRSALEDRPLRTQPEVRKVEVEQFQVSGMTFRRGKTAELRDRDFLRIEKIMQDEEGNIYLEGRLLRRFKAMNALAPFRQNELCWIVQITEEQESAKIRHVPEEIQIGEVRRLREVHFSNHEWKRPRYPSAAIQKKEYDIGPLFCRYKYLTVYRDIRKPPSIWDARAMIRLSPEEADNNYTVDLDTQRERWRGETVLGGSEECSRKFSASSSSTGMEFRTMARSGHRAKRQQTHPCNIEDNPKASDTARSVPGSTRVGPVPAMIALADNKAHARSTSNAFPSKTASQVTPTNKPSSIRKTVEEDNEKLKDIQNLKSNKSCWPATRTTKELIRTKDGSVHRQTKRHALLVDIDASQMNDEWSLIALEDVPPSLRSCLERTEAAKQQMRKKSSASASSCPTPSSRKRPAENPSTADRQYTYGDAFCGAGGMSRGAKQIGLRVKWGFDNNKWAIKAYQYNFGADGTWCEHAANDLFLTNDPTAYRVDIMHLSPPCQTFSPAHTTAKPGRSQDEDNESCIFTVEPFLRRFKPRIVTMEETAGLATMHPRFLHAVISMFVSVGYSVRWKVVNLAEYGLCQARKRLIIIGAG